MSNVALIVLRSVFVMVAIGLGVGLINSKLLPRRSRLDSLAGDRRRFILLAAGVIGIDALVPRKQLETISAVYFGLIVGLFLTSCSGRP